MTSNLPIQFLPPERFDWLKFLLVFVAILLALTAGTMIPVRGENKSPRIKETTEAEIQVKQITGLSNVEIRYDGNEYELNLTERVYDEASESGAVYTAMFFGPDLGELICQATHTGCPTIHP